MASLRHVAAAVALLVVFAGCVSVGGPVDAGAGTGGAEDVDGGEPTATAVGTPVGTPVPSTAPRVTVEVVEVVDGDTVKVRYPNGSRETVRLLGVDTPEVRGENAPDEYEGVPDTERGRQCLATAGDRASDYATERLAGRTVELGFDEAEGRRGYYGRLLAYVYVDDRQFNYDLVATGHARVYDSGFLERDRYETVERDARAAGRGLWGCATDPTATDGEAATPSDAPIAVVEVHADAAGADGDNLGDEYVILQNTGDAPADLTGWTLADAAGHEYRFPETTLDPGETVTVRTGRGSDEPGVRYWGRSRPVWNNDGDTVILRDAAGRVVVERSY